MNAFLPGAPFRKGLTSEQTPNDESTPSEMADLIVTETAGMHRPRNLDWKRAAALLYGDWGTSKAYVIGLAFVATGYASFPIILAVALPGSLPAAERPRWQSDRQAAEIMYGMLELGREHEVHIVPLYAIS